MITRKCPHGFDHPNPFDARYPHSCDGCWCEGLRDRRDYGWDHDTSPDDRWNFDDASDEDVLRHFRNANP